MFKKLWNFNLLYIILLCFLALQTVGFYFTSDIFFWISASVFFVTAIVVVIRIVTSHKSFEELISSINDDLNATASNALTSFNLPTLIVSESDEIVWYNTAFENQVNSVSDSLIGKNIIEIIGTDGLSSLNKKHIATVPYANRIFDVFETLHTLGGTVQRIMCFTDVTRLRKTASEYKLSRPVVAFIAVDNLDDLTKDMRDSERGNVSSRIQKELEDWFSTVNGISRKLSGERYIFVFEERDLISFITNKFDILNRIRNIDFGERGRATISIGIGHGNNFKECEEQAAQALDMALGRGGDQVAVKSLDNSFQFFGKASGSNEKRTRVRTRIVASALNELINNSENIVIMGHKFADSDCYGAAFALCSAIRKRTDKQAVIAINKKTALVKPLFERISYLGADLMTLPPEEVLPTVNNQTLLIILDTHRPSMVECPEMLDLAGTVAVIDHHRKAVDFINNSVIFYHETAASSTCEMVSELLQYYGESYVGKPEAEAMLAGITLDTKNFCMNTGVRTFEASAFVRKRGADPIAVRKLFADSIDEYKIKNNVVATAEEYKKKYAIAVNSYTDMTSEERKILSSQAADELLNISGVKASFVLSVFDDYINISSRSYGDVNVQLIMENLGGGGHRTMAACQINDIDINNVKQLLIKAINMYEEG